MLKSTVQQYVYWQAKEAFLLESDTDAHWIMYVIEEGSCQFTIGEYHGVAHAGDVLICSPYTIFSRKVLTPMTFHFFRFVLHNELMEEVRLQGLLKLRDTDHLTFTSNILKKIQYDDSQEIKSFRNHLLSDILYMYYYENSLIIQIEQKNIKDTTVRLALPLLADLGQDALSVTEISESLNVNPCHFSRKFKQIMGGVTPVEYRNKIRLQEAQKRLIETNDSIEMIAEQCGYSNGFYFSRIFTKFMGEAPSSYRNNHKI